MRLVLLCICVVTAISATAYFLVPFTQDQPIARLKAGPFRSVLVIADKDAVTSRAYLIFQNGEVDNTFSPGLAHYVEHLAWLNAFENDGAARHANAWTNKLTTGYWVNIAPKDDFARLQRLLKVAEPIDIETKFALEERNIVAREYDLRVTGNAYHSVFAEINQTMFGDSPWSRSVIGTKDDIAKFSLDDSKALHQASHRLEDAVLVVYGDVSIPALNRFLQKLPSRQTETERSWPEIPADPLRSDRTLKHDGLADPMFIFRKLISLEGCTPEPKCAEAIEILQSILSSTLPGGIAGPLRFDDFIARNFHLSLDLIGDRNLSLHFQAVPDSGVTTAQLQQSFEQVFQRIVVTGIPDETRQRITSQQLSELDAIQRPAQVLRNRVTDQISARREVYDLDQTRSHIMEIDQDYLNKILDQFTQPGRVVIRRVEPAL